MFAASVPGVLLMVLVAIVLMTLIAWLLPMGASIPTTTTPRRPRDAGDADLSLGRRENASG
jgi:hypothetical protein